MQICVKKGSFKKKKKKRLGKAVNMDTFLLLSVSLSSWFWSVI